MTAPWGPALDAEIAYRREQIGAQFGRRPLRRFRRHAPVTPSPTAVSPSKPLPASIPLQHRRAGANAGASATTRSTGGRAGSSTTRRAA